MNDTFDFWAAGIDIDMAPACFRRKMDRAIDRRIAVMEIGRSVCFGKGGGDAPSPDPQIGKAALMNAELGEDWLDFAKEQFAVGNIRQEEMDSLTKTVIDQQLQTAEQQQDWASKDRQRYADTFQPLQDEFIKTAKEYDSPEKQAQAASEAKTDVMRSAEAQQQIGQRQMASMGLNPASGRFQGISRSADTDIALAAAGAQNNARQMIRDKGLGLRADAINMGNGLPAQSAQAASVGLNAGNSATGNSNQAMGSWRANTGIMSQGFQGAQQGYSNQGNILSNLYGKQVDAWGTQQQANATSSAGLGAAVGTVAAAALMM